MTFPQPSQPHQDPVVNTDPSRVTVTEHVSSLIAALDRRFDSLHEDLKTHVGQRFTDTERLIVQGLGDADLRYQQRFEAQAAAVKAALDAQTKALDAALAAQKEAVTTALAAAERATVKSDVSTEKRFESVNEFRRTLSDQTHSFMPRSEAETRLIAMVEKIDDLRAYQFRADGKEASSPTTSAQITALQGKVDQLRDSHSTALGIARGSNVETRLDALAAQIETNTFSRASGQGRSNGLAQGWLVLVGAVGVIATIIGLIFALNK
jgi:hypothetical protein